MPCNSCPGRVIVCSLIPSDISAEPGPFENRRPLDIGTDWGLGRKAFMQAAIMTGRQDTTSAVESYPNYWKSIKVKQYNEWGSYLHNRSNRKFGPVASQNIWKHPSSPHGKLERIWNSQAPWKRETIVMATHVAKVNIRRIWSRLLSIWKRINGTASSILSEITLATIKPRLSILSILHNSSWTLTDKL